MSNFEITETVLKKIKNGLKMFLYPRAIEFIVFLSKIFRVVRKIPRIDIKINGIKPNIDCLIRIQGSITTIYKIFTFWV
jgi:hypothetical protein